MGPGQGSTSRPGGGSAELPAAAPTTGLSDEVRERVRAALTGRVELDPEELEERPVRRAVLVVASLWPIALDADTGTWVRPVLPAGLRLSPGASLSPDGTRFLEAGYDLTVHPLDGSPPTGLEPDVPERLNARGWCRVDGGTWARDDDMVLATVGCSDFDPDSDEVLFVRHLAVEIDPADGSSRVVDDSDGSPVESYPRWSPSGETFVAGWPSFEGPPGVRTFGPDGPRHFWPGTHIVYGDPWRDERTVLVWGEEIADDHLLLDTVTGDAEPVTVGLANPLGYVGGRLVEDGGLSPGCRHSACFVDTTTGEREPWLDLGDSRAGYLMLADALVKEALG